VVEQVWQSVRSVTRVPDKALQVIEPIEELSTQEEAIAESHHSQEVEVRQSSQILKSEQVTATPVVPPTPLVVPMVVPTKQHEEQISAKSVAKRIMALDILIFLNKKEDLMC